MKSEMAKKTEGQRGQEVKDSWPRVRGQNLEQTMAECIFFFSVLTETYVVGAQERGKTGRREGGKERGRETEQGGKAGSLDSRRERLGTGRETRRRKKKIRNK